MARGKPAAEADVLGIGFDSRDLMDGWFAQQRDLLDTTLGAWTTQQQLATRAWFGWLDAMAAPAAAWPGLPSLPEDLMMAGPRLLQAWWAPWAPFIERGGEQLG